MSATKLVIFDCDGTLLDSQHAIVAAMNEAFCVEGFELPERKSALSIVGLSLIEAMQVLLPRAQESDHTRLAARYKSVFHQFLSDRESVEILYDGARETVLRLASTPDTLLGIATGKSQRGVRRMLSEHGMQDCFVTIQTADDAPSKPHPAMIEKAMAEAGVLAENTAMVGDTTYDIDMAHHAGVHALAVSWGYHDMDALMARNPTSFSHNFNELDIILDKFIEHGLGRVDGR